MLLICLAKLLLGINENNILPLLGRFDYGQSKKRLTAKIHASTSSINNWLSNYKSLFVGPSDRKKKCWLADNRAYSLFVITHGILSKVYKEISNGQELFLECWCVSHIFCLFLALFSSVSSNAFLPALVGILSILSLKAWRNLSPPEETPSLTQTICHTWWISEWGPVSYFHMLEIIFHHTLSFPNPHRPAAAWLRAFCDPSQKNNMLQFHVIYTVPEIKKFVPLVFWSMISDYYW